MVSALATMLAKVLAGQTDVEEDEHERACRSIVGRREPRKTWGAAAWQGLREAKSRGYKSLDALWVRRAGVCQRSRPRPAVRPPPGQPGAILPPLLPPPPPLPSPIPFPSVHTGTRQYYFQLESSIVRDASGITQMASATKARQLGTTQSQPWAATSNAAATAVVYRCTTGMSKPSAGNNMNVQALLRGPPSCPRR